MTCKDQKAGLKITGVAAGSPAERNALRPGDLLLRINGQVIRDHIDYRYHSSEETLVVEVKQQGQDLVANIRKEIDEDLGLELMEPRYRTCRNQCIFCFVHQMPPGLRQSLYVKDDDYRLSFMHGNYITLTNLEEQDFQRIFQQHLSPLYVSVHATDDRIRREILGNPEAPPLLPLLRRFASQGIELHTQIVLCPGVNDGAILDRSIKDLKKIWPQLKSVAVVPVGLTGHRARLPLLQPVDSTCAEKILNKIHPVQEACSGTLGDPWIFPSDEFYLIAQVAFPPLSAYGELAQLENGVGMVPLFLAEIEEDLAQWPPSTTKKRVTLGTGRLAYPVLAALTDRISRRTGVEIDLIMIENRFFGDSVTVTGLITGTDLLQALPERRETGPIVLPGNMLRPDGKSFLDGMTVKGVEKQLGYPLSFAEPTGPGLLAAIRTVGGIS